MTIRVPLPYGFDLDLDLDQGGIWAAFWSWHGLTFAEAHVGLA